MAPKSHGWPRNPTVTGPGVVGSCGRTDLQPYSSPGNPSIIMTASKGGAVQNSGVWPTIGWGPSLFQVWTPGSPNLTIRNGNTAVIFGNGFSVNGGNWVWLYNPSTGASRQFSAGADSFSGNDYRFITFNLGYYLQPGAYTMYVANGYSYYLGSANVQITY